MKIVKTTNTICKINIKFKEEKKIVVPESFLVNAKIGWTFILLMFCSLSFIIRAQNPSNEKLHFKEVNPDLLTDVNPGFIFFSRSGKMWLSTTKGLASFDGISVIYHNTPDELPSLGIERITCLAEDADENIWIGSPSDGLSVFKKKEGTFEKIPLQFKTDTARNFSVLNIFVDDSNNIWVGTFYQGFFIYHPSDKSYEHYNIEPGHPDNWADRYRNTVKGFLTDPGDPNKIWMATYAGIKWFDVIQKKIHQKFKPSLHQDSSLTHYLITEMGSPLHDTIWFGTWGSGMGCYAINSGTYTVFPGQQSSETSEKKDLVISGLSPKNSSEYFISCYNYLPAVFNTKSFDYHFIQSEDINAVPNETYDILFDAHRNLWISKSGSLYVSSPSHHLFQNIDVSYQSTPNTIPNEMWDMMWDEKEKKYYASLHHSSGVYEFDEHFNLLRILPMPLFKGHGVFNEASVWKTLKDGAGRLWALGDILCVFNEKLGRFLPANTAFPDINFFHKKMAAFAIDESGNLIFLSNTRKIYFLDAHNLQPDSLADPDEDIHHPNLVTQSFLTYDLKNKSIYFTGHKAIVQFNRNTQKFQWIVYDTTLDNTLPEKDLMSMALDETGRLWISSKRRGIYIYEPTQLKKVMELAAGNKSIPSSANLTLTTGQQGQMVIQTDDGVLMYDIDKNTFLQIDKSNGLKSNTPIGLSVANQKLFIGTYDLIQYADLGQLLTLYGKVNPYLSNILVSGKSLLPASTNNPAEEIQLSAGQNTITFSFSAIQFLFPERIQYAYKLEGIDPDWKFTDQHNRLHT